MPTVERDDLTLVVRGPWFTRLGGPYMCLIAAVGFVLVTANEPIAALAIGPLWSGPGIWWGLRLARLGVLVRPSGLVIRNPIRTYELAWVDIRDVRYESRRSSKWQRFSLFFLHSDRRIGVVDVAVRPVPIEVYATETFRFAFYGWLFSQKPETAEAKVERVRSLWLEHSTTP
jgi:hypothetical protein